MIQQAGRTILRFLAGAGIVILSAGLLAVGLFILVNGGGCSSDTAQAGGAAAESTNKDADEKLPQGIISLGLPAIFGVEPERTEDESAFVPEDTGMTTDPGIQPDTTDTVKIELEKMAANTPAVAPLAQSGSGPRILVYHSHTHEAYRQTSDYTYVACGSWRTEEQSKSIVAVGDVLTRNLSEQYKLPVYHDKTDNELNDFYGSYPHSLKMIEADKKKYPGLQVFIDIHRDAASGEAAAKDAVTLDGKRCAKVMFVVGTGEGKTGNGFTIKPDWKANYAFANAVTEELKKIAPGLVRPIRTKTGRYNMHVSTHCLVVEIGHNMNTLEEAQNSMPYVAKAISNVLSKMQLSGK